MRHCIVGGAFFMGDDMKNTLENIRLRMKMTQCDFAEKVLDISLSTYKRILNDSTNKYDDAARMFSRIYNRTGWLIYQIYEGIQDDPRLRLISKISTLNRDSIRMVESYTDIIINRQKRYEEIDIMEAVQKIALTYHKIVKINVTEDSYHPIMVNRDEWNAIDNKTGKISVWFKRFCESGYIHEDDLEDFKAFTNVKSLKRLLRRDTGYIRHRYRRYDDGKWIWVSMEIVRSSEYTDENQIAIVYIRDIGDEI